MIANPNENDSTRTILPGSTIGIFGGGQLGRMMSIAAKRMGYKVNVFTPENNSPASQVCDSTCTAEYLDLESVAQFASQVDVITYEFEHIPLSTIECACDSSLVRPNGKALAIAQDRLQEKRFFESIDAPIGQFEAIDSLVDLKHAHSGFEKSVLKTRNNGYDGKGQVVLDPSSDLEQAWDRLDRQPAILEEFIPFESEFSVLAARSGAGQFVAYPPIANHHVNQILELSSCPWSQDKDTELEAIRVANKVMDHLQYEGLICIEFFLLPDGKFLVNEMAPRPHNSGHLTIDAHITDQFEQHIRAVCNLPLGSVRQHAPAAMINLLGDEWETADPIWANALSLPNSKLHLYGKSAARRGRKMGHITALAQTTEQSIEFVTAAKKLLKTSDSSLDPGPSGMSEFELEPSGQEDVRIE